MAHRRRPVPNVSHRGPLSNKGLANLWNDGACSHTHSEASAYGWNVELACSNCDKAIRFTLRFGRPKTFDIVVVNGAGKELVTGKAFSKAVVDFVLARSNGIGVTEEGWVGRQERRPKRDAAMLLMLMDEFGPTPDPDVPTENPDAEWGTECGHESLWCSIYGDCIGMKCDSCRARLSLDMRKDSFFVNSQSSIRCYGLHSAESVVSYIRKRASFLKFPTKMADKLSGDPERDALGVARMVELLIRHGLLKRVKSNESPTTLEIAEKVNVVNMTRKKFDKKSEGIADSLTKDGLVPVRHGRLMDVREALEEARLQWLYGVEAVGIDMKYYDPAGMLRMCVKCGFSTRDEQGGGGAEVWKWGCRECGYAGYLLDI